MHLLQLLEIDHWLELAYFMKGSTYHQLCLRPSQEVEADWSNMRDKLSRSVNYVNPFHKRVSAQLNHISFTPLIEQER